jgi:hypothetical protein
MGNKIVVTGVFSAVWDVDEFRSDFDETGLSDKEILEECLQTVRDNPHQFIDGSLHVQGDIS